MYLLRSRIKCLKINAARQTKRDAEHVASRRAIIGKNTFYTRRIATGLRKPRCKHLNPGWKVVAHDQNAIRDFLSLGKFLMNAAHRNEQKAVSKVWRRLTLPCLKTQYHQR